MSGLVPAYYLKIEEEDKVRVQGWSQPPAWRQKRRSGERSGLVPASYLKTEQESR